jgi:hypothetical protein
LRNRGRGAVYYPTQLSGIYQAAQNMATTHLIQNNCTALKQVIPNTITVREELQRLRQNRDNASAGKNYWADAAKVLGVYETVTGLRYRSPHQQQEQRAANSIAKEASPNDANNDEKVADTDADSEVPS